MNKKVLVLLSVLLTFSVIAQQVVSTQGDSYTNANGSIDFTIGEVVINTGTDGTIFLTQGYHQTNWNFVSGCDLELTATTTAATLGFANGSATVSTSGGTAPFTYSWNDPFEQTTAAALGMFPGTYICTVSDVYNCIETISVTVPLQTGVPLTQVRAQFCNTGGYILSDVVSCDAVHNAADYRWEFTPQGGSTLPEYTRGSSNYNVRFSWVTGIELGVTYEVRVKALVNGTWGEYGPMCTLTTTSDIPLTEVHPAYTPFNPSSAAAYTFCNVLRAVAVANASAYEWEFTGTNTIFATTSGYNLSLSSVSGLLMNTSYQVRVRAQIGGVWGTFGPSRPVDMGIASTSLWVLHCNSTRTLNQAVAAYNVCGASYDFKFVHATEPERIVARPTYTCGLNLPNPALTPGETYSVSVRVTQGGYAGTYGTACNVTIAGPQQEEILNEFTADRNQESGDYQIYPNPTADVLNIYALTYENVTYTLYDAQGKLVLKDNLTQAQTLIHIQSLSAGIYTLSLHNQTQYLETFKLVKTH